MRSPFVRSLLFLLFLLPGLPPGARAATYREGVQYKVNSTEVAWVVYENKTQTLFIAHRSGGLTEYYNVPPDIFQRLMANDFMGGFIKANIDRKYPSKLGRLAS